MKTKKRYPRKFSTLCSNILRLRKKYGYTQTYLAKLLKVTTREVQRWEGNEAIPSLTHTVRIANLFYKSLNKLVFEKIYTF